MGNTCSTEEHKSSVDVLSFQDRKMTKELESCSKDASSVAPEREKSQELVEQDAVRDEDRMQEEIAEQERLRLEAVKAEEDRLCKLAEEKKEKEEQERLEAENLRLAEAARLAEAKKIEEQQKEEEKKKKVDEFLKLNKFSANVTHTKKEGRKEIYPLHTAIKKGAVEIVQAMLDMGVDIDKKSGGGRNAMGIAQKHKQHEVENVIKAYKQRKNLGA